MSKNIAVVLSGVGFKDGTEITEAVSAFIALSEEGVNYSVFAPDKEFDSINHISGESTGLRNIMVEAGRISRGKIQPLEKLKVDQFDGIVFPGGYGAATHLCNFASKGASGSVEPVVKKIITDFHEQSKSIAAFCIAPALVALVLGEHGVALTIGNEVNTALEIEKTGSQHVECKVDDYVTDRENKVITTPAYMYDEASPFQVFTGIRKAVREFVEMA